MLKVHYLTNLIMLLKFIKCQFSQRQKESRKGVQYKLIPFVLPSQFLSPLVNLNEKCMVIMEEY